MKEIRIVISGGGTGGHIFPALSIAGALREAHPEVKILFVGAEGRMEMTRVPAAGYEIKGLPIEGLNRKNLLKNVRVLWKFIRCKRMAKQILRDFAPHCGVGVGGYASGPTMSACRSLRIPYVLQEQNSFAGKANKLVAGGAARICVAYEGMERFFPADRLMLTGNPVRSELLSAKVSREVAIKSFGLDPSRKTLLIVGGSLGARTINESVLNGLEQIAQSRIQVIWQTGKSYHADIMERLAQVGKPGNLYVNDFLADMAKAYKAADMVISRAGASSISELCLLGKPCILVPSPNVAEDHQTKNAMALVHRKAALYVKDSDAREQLIPTAIATIEKPAQLVELSKNISEMALPNAAKVIAQEVWEAACRHAGQNDKQPL